MSKYKVGDKVVLTVTSTNEMGCLPCYVLNDDLILSKQDIDKYTEPLTTYTEPLEDKIRRQAAEITRLLAENKELKEDFEKSKRVNLNMGRLAGQNEAWELANKITCQPINGGFKQSEFEEIFGYDYISDIFEKYSYVEAAAKVEVWEKAKEKICMGDVVRFKGNNSVEFCVTDTLDNSFLYGINAKGGIYSNISIKFVEKTGRHIDIDGFLKQIGGEE